MSFLHSPPACCPGSSLLASCFGSSSVDVFLFQISYEISLALVLIPPRTCVVWFLMLRVLTPPSLTFSSLHYAVCDRSGSRAMRLSVGSGGHGAPRGAPVGSSLPAETAPGFLRPGLPSAPASPVLAGQSCWGPAVLTAPRPVPPRAGWLRACASSTPSATTTGSSARPSFSS